nr:mechanosensitive ion channel family protein [Petrachloros mirabilis]
MQVPLKTLGVILAVYGLVRLSNILVDRLFLVLQEDTLPVSLRSKRLTLRFSTVSRVAKNILGLLWVVIGLLTVLAILGLDLGPLLAGAGIIGLALSLASQNVLKDMINGFLILLEDQYGVGDIVIVGTAAGLVENMNLRITQLRNTQGNLITIPNGQIDIVENLSKEWARVDLSIPIALSADLDQALHLIKAVADSLSQDPLWKGNILEPPQMLGVDDLGVGGATLRIWIKTQPLKQFEVGREFRHRLKLAFDKAQIALGVPQQSLVMQQTQPTIQDLAASQVDPKVRSGQSAEPTALPEKNHQSHHYGEHHNPNP